MLVFSCRWLYGSLLEDVYTQNLEDCTWFVTTPINWPYSVALQLLATATNWPLQRLKSPESQACSLRGTAPDQLYESDKVEACNYRKMIFPEDDFSIKFYS